MSHAVAIAVLSLPAAACGCAGLLHLRRMLARRPIAVEDAALTLAWAYPLGALVWLEAWLTDTRLLGFGAPWTWLTAAHFLAAGFGALTVTGHLVRLVTDERARRVLRVLLVVHPLAFAATAAGITGVPGLDELGAPAYAILFVAQLVAFVGGHGLRPRSPARVVLAVALCVPVLTLVPAVAWAWGRPPWSLDHMIRGHGIVNAAGHVGLGLAALACLRARRR